jgi:GNAT superfamily N-acetyltransferase
VLLLFTGLTPPILLTVGAPEVVAELLAQAALPEQVFISARLTHVPPIEQYYRFDQPALSTSFHRMARMAFRHPQALADVTLTGVKRLGPADAARIATLIAHGGPYAPDAFDPYQLDEGVFFGINGTAGALLAVGGTHIVDWTAGVGAIGNMYTHPAHRGQGYARSILGAIVKTLQEGGVDNLILNVNTQNHTARRIYEQYGFVVHCEFAEGIGVMRKT